MYKLIVHKGDYITYKRSERIITECVKDIYKRLDDIGTTGGNIRSIKKHTSMIEAKPNNIVEELTHLHSLEIYSSDGTQLNPVNGKFIKCQISNSDDLIWDRTDTEDEIERMVAYIFGYIYRSISSIGYSDKGSLLIRFDTIDFEKSKLINLLNRCSEYFNRYTKLDDELDISSVTTGVYNNGTTMCISSDNTDEGFIPEFRTILSRWFDVKVGEFIQHHSAIPTGLLNAKSKIKQSFIDGLADYIDDRYGAESIKNGMILDLLLEGYGKEFMISYRLLLETMNISYYSFMERTLVYEKGKILASRTFVDIFRDIALSNTQLVSLRRGESPSSKCYLLEVDEMVGVNGYKFVHK